MDGNYIKKEQQLIENINKLKSVLVAFSGGVDSAYLAFITKHVLKDQMAAILFTTQLHTANEIKEAYNFAHNHNIPLKTLSIDVLNSNIFKENPRNRCYHCKKLLFQNAIGIAQKLGFKYVVDGSNANDVKDFRPGAQAIKELKVISPLQMANLTKSDIRSLSKKHNLETHNKEAMACLATRIPFGEEISCKKLAKVELAELYLRELGFKQVRARYFNETIKIEVLKEQVNQLNDQYKLVQKKMEEIGFIKTVIDDSGYRMGSLNNIKP